MLRGSPAGLGRNRAIVYGCWLLLLGFLLIFASSAVSRGSAPNGRNVWEQEANPAALAAPQLTATPLNPDQKYTESSSKNLGRSVALSADGATMVVGAYDANGDNGRAYVFTRSGNSWAWVAALTPTTPTTRSPNDWFGVSVAIDGNTIVVGASRYNNNAGAAFVFTRPSTTDNTWSQKQYLPAPSRGSFGFSVAIQGNLIAIGARFDDHETTNSGNDYGAVYLFRPKGPVAAPWEQTAKITASVRSVNHYFGEGVDIDGDLLAVRAYAGPDTNAAYLIRLTGFTGTQDNWEEFKRISIGGMDVSPDPPPNYDLPIAIRGDLLVVGAYLADLFTDSGMVYLYGRNQGGMNNWGLLKTLVADDLAAYQYFGMSVDVSSDYVVVGAPGKSGEAISTGSVYLFSQANNWSAPVSKLVAPVGDAAISDRFGRAVAIQANQIAIGAVDDGNQQGAVYLYNTTLITSTPTSTPTPTASPTYTLTSTPTPSPTGTLLPTHTPTSTATPSPTPTGTLPPTHTPTQIPTQTFTPLPGITPGPDDSSTHTPTATVTPSPVTPVSPSDSAGSLYLAVVSNPLPNPPTPMPTATATALPQWRQIGVLPVPTDKLLSTSLALQGQRLWVGARSDPNNAHGGLYKRDLPGCATQPLDRVAMGQSDARTILGLVMHSSGKGVVAAFGERFFSSDNFGDTWTQTPDNLGARPNSVTTVDGQTVYAGTNGNGIYSSSDGGKNWQPVALAGKPINQVRLDQHGELWLGVNNEGVWVGATNPGARNTALPPGLEVWDFAFDTPHNQIYLATSQGVFVGNGNDPWQRFGNELQNVALRSLEIVGASLFAGTAELRPPADPAQQGVWERPLDGSRSWQQIATTWVVRDLLYEPTHCGGLLAATNDGVWVYK